MKIFKKQNEGALLLDITKTVRLAEAASPDIGILELAYAIRGVPEKKFSKCVDLLVACGFLWKQDDRLCLTKAGEALIELAEHFRQNKGTITERLLCKIWDALRAGWQW